jgi:hypothetical protein
MESQIAWYEARATQSYRWLRVLKVMEILVAASIPVAAAADAESWLLGLFGGLIVVIESVVQLFQFQSNWIAFRSTAEALKRERSMFLARAGDYAVGRPEAALAERVESILAAETAAWTAQEPPGARLEPGDPQLPAALKQGIREALRGPELINFDGWLRVELLDERSNANIAGGGRDVTLMPGITYTVRASIGTAPGPDDAVALVIANGRDAEEVEFVVQLDSDDPTLTFPTQRVRLATKRASEFVEFGLPPAAAQAGLRSFWVRVEQQDRMIQSVELRTGREELTT